MDEVVERVADAVDVGRERGSSAQAIAQEGLRRLRPGDRLPGGLVVVDADAYDGLRAMAEYRDGKSLEDVEAESAAAKE